MVEEETGRFSSIFFPPELQASLEDSVSAGAEGLGASTDIMRRAFFQRGKGSTGSEKHDRKLVEMVLDHAKKVIAHPSRPVIQRLETYDRMPWGELALDESLEENPVLSEAKDYLVSTSEEKRFSCVTMLDASSSMSGEKHLLASVAVAVLLLEVPSEDASLILFASDVKTVKPLRRRESVETTILNFLKTEPRGFTNIAKGLEAGLKQVKLGGSKRRVGLLASDGRSTEGKDPIQFAKEFDALVVLHLHGPGSHLDSSREMAQAGGGVCLEVEDFDALPRRLYDAIRIMARM